VIWDLGDWPITDILLDIWALFGEPAYRLLYKSC
jgi:hypothetical protein